MIARATHWLDDLNHCISVGRNEDRIGSSPLRVNEVLSTIEAFVDIPRLGGGGERRVSSDG
jgi:hypothetical protein